MPPRGEFEQMVQLFKGRMSTLADFLDWTDFIFSEQVHFQEEVRAQHLSRDMSREFELLAQALSDVT